MNKEFWEKNFPYIILGLGAIILMTGIITFLPGPKAVFSESNLLGANGFPTSLNSWGSGDTIESSWANALEAKIGVNNSSVVTSLDYLIKGGTDPGHKHTEQYGGTGNYSYSTGDILYASGANTLETLSVGSDGQVLKISGGVPAWGTDDGGLGSGWDFSTTTLDYYFDNTSGITGNSNIATVGTITSGTWNGTALADAYVADTITASDYLALIDWFATTSASQLTTVGDVGCTNCLNATEIEDIYVLTAGDTIADITVSGTTTTDVITGTGGYDIVNNWSGTGTPNMCIGACQ